MSHFKDPSLKHLDDCGCCQGTSVRTPVSITNRPGLTSIDYRVGSHARFKETMLARLSSADLPVLRTFTTREGRDFTIALLDAWAVVADVLSFYQERMANEHYLGTAGERFSVLELARLIGYRLNPGVAAGTELAFTLEDAQGAYGQALGTNRLITDVPALLPAISLEKGIKVQSIPGPNEQAQIFETVDAIDARADYNAIRPRLDQPQELSNTGDSFFLQGLDTGLAAGNTVLVIQSDGQKQHHRIITVSLDEGENTTRIDIKDPPAALPDLQRPVLDAGDIDAVPLGKPLDAALVAELLTKQWPSDDLEALAAIQNWTADDLSLHIRKFLADNASKGQGSVYAFRQQAAIFGYNAPVWDANPTSLRFDTKISIYQPNGTFVRTDTVPATFPDNWELRTLEDDAAASGNRRYIYLESIYPAITPGSWIVLIDASQAVERIVPVKANVEVTRSAFSISGKISRLTVETGSLSNFKMRTTTVLAQSQKMTPAAVPVETAVSGDTLVLDNYYYGLKIERRIVLTGERQDLAGVYASEARVLKFVFVEGGYTVITLDAPLQHTYVRDTLLINANVARATHGETVTEIMGSGDARQAFQAFALKQPPLTYVSDKGATGARSTLEVRVNDLKWQETDSFFDHGPDERIYVTQTDDDGTTRVRFGDGRTGAKPVTGQANLTIQYRKGIGLQGLVKAHQLTQLMTRPLGVKEVTNPIAANGAADPEVLADARRNAPLTVLAMDRIVSLQDYEDFAHAYSGIAKALATWTWIGERRGVFLTVAGPNGAPISKSSELYENLLDAMQSAGDPTTALVVESHEPRFFQIAAEITIDPDYLSDLVLSDMERQLRSMFSFNRRRFGQPVHRSEVLAVMQGIDGVVAVDINALYRTDRVAQINDLLPASNPQPSTRQATAAELLTLDARPLQLEVLS